MKLEGLQGSVFDLNGKVAGSTTLVNQPGSVRWQITRIHPASGECPSWADVVVASNIAVRMNPEICQPPFFRFFDLVALIAQKAHALYDLEDGMKAKVCLQGEEFFVWPELLQGHMVVLVDTVERLSAWNQPQATC